MKTKKNTSLLIAISTLILVTISCATLGGSPSPVATTSPPEQATSISPESPTEQAPAPQSTPEAQSQAPAPTSAGPTSEGQSPCTEANCVVSGDFLLSRPVGGNGRNTIDTSNRYGTYHSATKDTQHGVNFLNSSGTPVVAAADGTVVVAGDDSQTAYATTTNVYGNLVILQHNLPGISQPVFTLYGQLSQVSVKVNDSVKAGQEIGQVGMTGRVTGSTLHFEVRLGENTYQAARNPELWLQPLPDQSGQTQGALAGRVLDAKGEYMPIGNVRVDRLAGAGQPAVQQIYLKTYGDKRLMGLSPWEDSFAAGDLQPGTYKISFLVNNVIQQQVVEVKSGMLTLVNFQLK